MRCTALLLIGLCSVPASASDRVTPLVKAVRSARASVVNIHSEKSAKRNPDAIFSNGKDRKVSGMGTGIVVDERGYIVTNHHVVLDVDRLDVSLSDGSRYRAKVVSHDAQKDLAIIKIDPRKPLTVMPLGTSSDLMLAESVFAVGNAFGYEHTITSGIVSALSRDVEVNEDQAYYNLIQTDASINPGNSGGPLLNLDGKVVGINVAIRAGAQRIGFAIPIDDARKTIAQMLSPERLFGVSTGLITKDIKQAKNQQLVVSSVVSGSPAQKAGLAAGDVIVQSGDVQVTDQADLARSLINRRAGQAHSVQVRRAGKVFAANLTLGGANMPVVRRTAKPARTVSSATNGNDIQTKTWQILGLRLATLNQADHAQITPRYRGGMRVTAVRPNGPAAVKGVQAGDVLVGLHVWETLNQTDMAYVLDASTLSKHNPLTFYIVRRGETMFGKLVLNQIAAAGR